MDDMTECPGCGFTAAAPAAPSTVPPDRHASAQCWARYEELLARSYSRPAYRGVHQLVVDAYVAQHPSSGSRQEIQRLALCLMTLCLFIEAGADVRDGARWHKLMMADRPDYFHRLEPPPLRGLPTAADVLAAEDSHSHHRLVWAWSEAVWQAWEPQQQVIRDWNDRALRDRRP